MNKRHLFLVGYDVVGNSTRQRILRCVQHHALGGQQSFYQCWLTTAELLELLGQLRQHINTDTDRVVFVRLDPRNGGIQLGQAQAVVAADTSYFYIS